MEKHLQNFHRVATTLIRKSDTLYDQLPPMSWVLAYAASVYFCPIWVVLIATDLLIVPVQVTGVSHTWLLMLIYLGLRSYRVHGTLPYVSLANEEHILQPLHAFTRCLSDYVRLWSGSVCAYLTLFLLIEEGPVPIESAQMLWSVGVDMMSLLLPLIIAFETCRLVLHQLSNGRMLVIDTHTH